MPTFDRLVPIYPQTTIVERLERENAALRCENVCLRISAPQDWERDLFIRLKREVAALNKALASERSTGTNAKLREEIRKQQLVIEGRRGGGHDARANVEVLRRVMADAEQNRGRAAKENWQRRDDLDVTIQSSSGWTHCS
jgi:hypothetical protein